MKRAPAYTLIEVLIVVTILGIVALPGLVNYSRSQARQKLQAAAEILANHLRQARTFARDGRPGGPSNLSSSWGVVSVTDDEYDLKSQNATDGISTEENYRLNEGIVFSTASVEVWFERLSGNPQSGYTSSIELTNKYGQKFRVEISGTGVIEVEPL